MPLVIQRRELASVDSTNTYAKARAVEGAAAGMLVFAHEQTAGRGRQGNTWEARPGNLYASLILRPRVTAANMGQLSFVIALALAEAMAEILPAATDIALKWPNDILLNGRKCAGILLESEGSFTDGQLPWVVAGFGVNLVDAPEQAAHLADASGQRLTPMAFLDVAAPHLCQRYNEWETTGFMGIQHNWLQRATHLHAKIGVRLVRETLSGVFEGIDAQGALQLRLDDGSLRHISSGEVYL